MDDEPPIAEELTLALITMMVRKGQIDESDIETLCEGLSEEAAHQARCCLLDALAPKESDWRAEQARSRLRLITGGEE